MVWRLRHRIFLAFAVDRSKEIGFADRSRLRKQRAIGFRRPKCPLQVSGWRRIDAPVPFNVVTLGDRRRGVTEEGRRRVATHTPRDDRGARSAVPAQTDPGVREPCLDQELSKPCGGRCTG